MGVGHRSVDGSRVTFDGGGDLSLPATSLASFRMPKRRNQMFENAPPGRLATLLQVAEQSQLDYRVHDAKVSGVRDGSLVTAVVSYDGDNGRRTVTLGVWESEAGAVSASTSGDHLKGFHETLSVVPFEADSEGAYVSLRVLSEPRVPRMMKRIPGRALAIVSPLLRETRQTLPRNRRGTRVRGGEAYRMKAGSDAVALVSSSALVHLEPQPGDDASAALDDLSVEWVAGS